MEMIQFEDCEAYIDLNDFLPFLNRALDYEVTINDGPIFEEDGVTKELHHKKFDTGLPGGGTFDRNLTLAKDDVYELLIDEWKDHIPQLTKVRAIRGKIVVNPNTFLPVVGFAASVYYNVEEK